MKTTLIYAVVMGLLVQMALALDYGVTPMNFPLDESRSINVNVASPGDSISVTYPPEFSLTSGAASGIGTVNFVLSSPNQSSNGDIYYLNLSINGTYVDRMTLLAVPDSQIVDNKWELGHGDFNYPSCQYLPNETVIIFPIIRVWGVGTDLLQEEAKNVTFTCNFPKIRPRTVDDKYTTDYTDPNNLIATGLLQSMEGESMFRIFVLSQEFDGADVSPRYEATCSNVMYTFDHHTVVAPIPPINITIVDTNPFSVSTLTTSEYVQYSITNIAAYEVRDIEFEWKSSTNNQVAREEKSSMSPGEVVVYRVWANGNPTITLDIRQKPCWMFASRNPTYYDTIQTGTYNINGNSSTQLFSVEEKIFYSITNNNQNIQDQLDELLFLFKINQEEYHGTISILPTQQQNEANFTCYRVAMQSNGFNIKPTVRILTNATSASDVIVKNDAFLTKEFDFNIDNDGYGVLSWETELGACGEDEANDQYVCPKTNNYFCLKEGTYFQKAAEQPTGCVFCREKVLEIGKGISPTYPAIGAFALIAIIVALVYLYYYYEDDISLRNIIQNRKSKKEYENYQKWRENEQRRGGF